MAGFPSAETKTNRCSWSGSRKKYVLHLCFSLFCQWWKYLNALPLHAFVCSYRSSMFFLTFTKYSFLTSEMLVHVQVLSCNGRTKEHYAVRKHKISLDVRTRNGEFSLKIKYANGITKIVRSNYTYFHFKGSYILSECAWFTFQNWWFLQ